MLQLHLVNVSYVMNENGFCALPRPLSSTASSDHELRTNINDCSRIKRNKIANM